jgi:hypothetical protein
MHVAQHAVLLTADCCLSAAADRRAWFKARFEGLEVWRRDQPLSAEEVQGLLVSPVIKQILQKQGPKTQVSGNLLYSLSMCKCCCAGSTLHTSCAGST